MPVHVASDFYDVEAFRAGRSTLKPKELAAVGDVRGRSLLHLMCHFGLDTLSWARLGAEVTGVDFSEPAIAQARALADELGLRARFVVSDLYELPEKLEGEFDLVYTSWGILCWLPDAPRWARVIAHFLRPEGRFHLFEFHPVAVAFDRDLKPAYSYFHDPEGLYEEFTGTYADMDSGLPQRTWQWAHTTADVVNALIDAGLVLERIDEYPTGSWMDRFNGMELTADGWRIPGDPIPLGLHVEARKPG